MNTNMQPVFLGHPGPFGDIIVCAPIAKEYADRGHKVYWPARVEYLDLLDRFNYVSPLPLPHMCLIQEKWASPREAQNLSDILMSQSICSEMGGKYLHVGDRFVDGQSPLPSDKDGKPLPPNTSDLSLSLREGETIEEKKYRISEVDFEKKYTLNWKRDKDKENKLFDLVVSSDNYVFGHLLQSDSTHSSLPSEETRELVEARIIEGYTILDWYKVIVNAKAVYCIESSFQCFVDGIRDQVKNKYLLSTKEGITTTTSRDWDRKFMGVHRRIYDGKGI